jgi:hypothetical protein
LKPEPGAVRIVVVEEPAALEHLENRAGGRTTQLEAAPSVVRLETRGFDKLNEGQVRFGDRIEIENQRLALSKGRSNIVTNLTNICYGHAPGERDRDFANFRQGYGPMRERISMLFE